LSLVERELLPARRLPKAVIPTLMGMEASDPIYKIFISDNYSLWDHTKPFPESRKTGCPDSD
jgi:hypothetical protein